MKRPGIDRLLELQRFMYLFQSVKRVVHHPSKELENDVEHSYSLAMTGWYLAHYFPELDRDKIIRYALAHDLVEVHAGDTYVFADEATLASKHTREAAALQQITDDWPDFPELTQTIETYEQRSDAESAFVYALDKIMPIMAIYIADGYTWKQEQLSLERLHNNKKSKVVASPEIDAYYTQLLEILERSPHLIDPR